MKGPAVTTPPPYGSTPGQPQGYPPPQGSGPAGSYPQGAPGYPGSAPGYPAPAPGYPPSGGQPAAYGPPPGYPAAYPAYGPPATPGRPGITTAAAVLAFIFGAGAIIQSLFGIVIGSLFSSATNAVGSLTDSGVSIACDTTLPGFSQSDCDQARAGATVVHNAAGSIGAFGIILGIGAAIVAILMIWGGVVLLSGKNAQIVVIACGIYFLVAIALIIATTFGFFYIFGLVLPVLITVFTLNGSTKAWVRSKGGKTF